MLATGMEPLRLGCLKARLCCLRVRLRLRLTVTDKVLAPCSAEVATTCVAFTM